MRPSIIVLILAVVIGVSVISFGFMTNQEQEIVGPLSPYEKLVNYKEELEKINQYNQKVLRELQQKIADSDNANLQLQEEVKVLIKVIGENKAELEQVMQRLSKMESSP